MANLVDKSFFEHARAAQIEALVKNVTIGQQAELQGPIALKSIAAGSEKLGYGTTRDQADFERAHHFGNVVGMDTARGFTVEPREQSVKRAGPARLARGQPVAQILVARGTFEQAVEQRAEVETRAAGHDGQSAARRDRGNRLARQAGKFARG